MPRLSFPKPMASTGTGARLRAFIPLVVAFGFMMEQLDSTIIVTAIPDIAHSLHETPVRLNLAITSYVLSLAVFIPISGWIADRFGARAVICAAFGIFTGASAACGMSTSLAMLVLTRILQGMGGAMMTPVGRLILLRAFPKDQLVRAMTFVSVPALIGPTIGPLLGGAITTYASWRWIFYVNVPLGLLAMMLSWAAVDDVRNEAPPRFDFPGFAIVGIALALLQLFIETVGRGEVGPGMEAAMLAGGGALLLLFVRYARRRANPVIDLTLFRLRTFRVGSLAGGFSRIGISAPAFLLPLLFQLGFGMTPVQSGSLTFAVSIGSIIIRPLSGKVLRHFGFRNVLVYNAVLAALFILGFNLFRPETPHWVLLLYIAAYGVARSLQFNAIQMVSYADMPPARLSASTSLGGVVQKLTQGLGVSISASLLGMLAGPGGSLTIHDFHLVFLVIAALPVISLPGFLSLTPTDGIEVSGYRPAQARPAVGD